ncbi:transformer-2 protein, partial [Tremellales sp. Uapishka_1]
MSDPNDVSRRVDLFLSRLYSFITSRWAALGFSSFIQAFTHSPPPSRRVSSDSLKHQLTNTLSFLNQYGKPPPRQTEMVNPPTESETESPLPGMEAERDPPEESDREVLNEMGVAVRTAGDGGNDDGAVNPGNNLHVSGIARNIDVPQLEDIFAKHGKVQKASIMLDPHTRESRGFGFVMMDTPEDAEAVIAALSGTTIDGKVMTVAHAKRARARTPTPGRYHGVKQDLPRGYGGGGGYDGDRPYMPRSYDSRYSDRGPPPSRYDDRDRRYDDRERRYDDRRDYGRDRYADDYYDRRAPPSDRDYYYRRDDRGPPPREERGYERREERPRYDERPRY